MLDVINFPLTNSGFKLASTIFAVMTNNNQQLTTLQSLISLFAAIQRNFKIKKTFGLKFQLNSSGKNWSQNPQVGY